MDMMKGEKVKMGQQEIEEVLRENPNLSAVDISKRVDCNLRNVYQRLAIMYDWGKVDFRECRIGRKLVRLYFIRGEA